MSNAFPFIPPYPEGTFAASRPYTSSMSSLFQDDTSVWPPPQEDNSQRTLNYREQLDAISTTFIHNFIPLPPSPLEGLAPVQPPSKFSDKINTNYIPNTAEIQEIKEYLSEVDQELFQLNAKITEMTAVLMELNKTRDCLQTVASQHQALISPVRRLPPELLQVIFVYCLPTHGNAVMHASDGAPVLLGRVCSEWRRISLSTPEVWSSLHIAPPIVTFSNLTSSEARFARERELIEMWLGRSGICPLNISFVWHANDSEDEIRLCVSLLEALVPRCGRWRMLDFQAPLTMFKPFVGLTVKDVPLLEGFSLMDNRTAVNVVDKWPESLIFAESAPNLKIFMLTFCSGGLRLPSIPWHQLTTLYLESSISFFFHDSREMLSTFAQCTHLQSCTVKFPLSHTAPISPFTKLDLPITLPQLEMLCLDGDQCLQNTFHMSNTLINICAPKLRKLEIIGRSGRLLEGSTSIAPEPLTAIKMLLERSKCPLENLTVQSISLVPEEFIGCLKLAPTLVELVVHNWAVHVYPEPQNEDGYNYLAENQILRALTVVDSCPQRVPRSTSILPIVQRQQRRRISRVEEAKERIENDSDTTAGALKTGEDLLDSQWKQPLSQPVSEILVEAPLSSEESGDHTLSLCPNLQYFDFNFCNASQAVLCDFVESRWVSPPPGVTHIKSIKCSFTAFEDEAVRMRLAKFKAEGLDVYMTFEMPVRYKTSSPSVQALEVPE